MIDPTPHDRDSMQALIATLDDGVTVSVTAYPYIGPEVSYLVAGNVHTDDAGARYVGDTMLTDQAGQLVSRILCLTALGGTS